MMRLSSRRRPRPAGHHDRAPAVPAHDEVELDALSDVRVLRLQVKALENALEEQSARVLELQAQVLAPNPDEDAITRMLLTIKGLRAAMADDPVADRVLSRVEAAIRRLEAAVIAARPVLPEPADHPAVDVAPAPVADAAPEPDVDVAPEPDAETAEAGNPEHADQAGPADGAEATDGEPPVPDDRVMPVPAPPAVEPAPRKRRWLRSSTRAA